MRQAKLWLAAGALVLFFGGAVFADHHEKAQGHGQGEGEMPPEMQAWLQYAAPAEPHKFLEKMAGKWSYTSKMWMDPSQPPMESSGTSESKMILGGRFLQTEYSGQMMGQPFHGMGIDGFDRMKEKYVSTWMDTMGTMIMVMEGTADAAGKIRTLVTEYTDAMTGQEAEMKTVTTLMSDDKHKFEMYNQGPDGKFFKSMEIVYTRR